MQSSEHPSVVTAEEVKQGMDMPIGRMKATVTAKGVTLVEDPPGPKKASRAKRLKSFARKPPYVPTHDDPREELRLIVQQHKAIVEAATAARARCGDRVIHATGEVVKSRLPEDVKTDILDGAEEMLRRAGRLETSMLRELRKMPVYQHFLSRVYGLGPIVCAYLCAMVDIHKAAKPSNLRRFVGLAVINGRLERPTKGQKLGYCAELRMRLYQAMSAMWKNSAKKTESAPYGSTSKYLDIWRAYKVRMQHSERYRPDDNILLAFDGESERPGAKAIIHATGWHKAADVLIEDLYVVWRTLEGLPVWPNYYESKLGFQHGGAPIEAIGPRVITLDEALARVGNPGAVPLPAPVAEAA